MTEPHITALGAARYVAGELESEEAQRLEAHVSSCPDCAATLASEARLHVLMEAVASRAEPAPRSAARPVWAALVAAAALLLVIVWRWPSDPQPPIARRAHPSCVADRSACAALRDEGRVPLEMLLAGSVWRYEERRPRPVAASEWLVSAEPAWEGP